MQVISRSQFIPLTMLLAFLMLAGCGGGGSEGGNDGESSGTRTSTNCGAIEKGKLESSIDPGSLQKVSVQVLQPDKVITTPVEGGGSQLVKLLGVSARNESSRSKAAGRSLIEALVSPNAFLLLPDEEPQEYVGSDGGVGVYGQLFSADGQSINEQVIAAGFASARVNGLFSDQLFECYAALEGTNDTSAEFRTTCGAFNNGELENPVRQSQFELVSVAADAPDFLITTLLEGPNEGSRVGVVLHGVSTAGISDFLREKGRELIETLSTPNAYLLRAGDNCIYKDGDARATLAELFSLDGKSFSEELIKIGAVVPSRNGCSANQLTSCYQTLEVDPPVAPTPDPIEPPPADHEEDDPQNYPDTEIDDFLWKPRSESDGNLVILVNVQGVSVRVSGALTETLVDRGPSNGRGTTARGSRPGCSYGRATVTFTKNGRTVLLKDGRSSVTISNGCGRVEFRLE